MLQIIRRYVLKYRAKALIGMVCKIIEVVFDLMTPIIVARMIDTVSSGGTVADVQGLVLLLVVFACCGYLFTLVCQKLASVISQDVGTDIRHDLFSRSLELAPRDVDAIGPASLVTRTTNDVNQIQVAVALGIRMLVRWPFIALGSIVAALLIDVYLGLAILVCMPLVVLAFWIVTARSIPLFGEVQAKLDTLARIVRENLSGMRVIRAFGREDDERERFNNAAAAQSDGAVRVGRLSAVLTPVSFLIMNLGIVWILWTGAQSVASGRLSTGDVVAFVSYMSQALVSIAYVANLVINFTRAQASATRIIQVLDTVPSIRDDDADKGAAGTADKPAPAANVPALAFEHAMFAYDDGTPALNDISLTLPQGATLGVIGGTGSGKSTLAKLAPRLFDATSGSVSVLGTDVRDWHLGDLRHAVSIVPQTASLMAGTIQDNLRWRDADASDDELWQALERAQAADFVRARHDGLNERVEAGGRNFSGGQRQRLTIARALVGSPALVVLDDSASALDYATDAKLRRALASWEHGPATVIISQRVAAVMGADQILVLDHGHMAGLGTHEELLDDCAIYREICASQLKKEVAA